MIAFLRKYLDILIYPLCGVILVIGSYNVLLNINQAKSLERSIIVRDSEPNYKEYQGNVLLIENEVEKIDNIVIQEKLRHVVNLMKSGGVYYLFPYSTISFMDLYDLNSYFIEALINNGWTSILRELVPDDKKIYNDYIKTMVSHYEYISKELLDNGNYYQLTSNDDVRDILEEEYKGILENYCAYSKVLLALIDDLSNQGMQIGDQND